MNFEQRKYLTPKEATSEVRPILHPVGKHPVHPWWSHHIHRFGWNYIPKSYQCPLQAHEAEHEWEDLLTDYGGEGG